MKKIWNKFTSNRNAIDFCFFVYLNDSIGTTMDWFLWWICKIRLSQIQTYQSVCSTVSNCYRNNPLNWMVWRCDINCCNCPWLDFLCSDWNWYDWHCPAVVIDSCNCFSFCIDCSGTIFWFVPDSNSSKWKELHVQMLICSSFCWNIAWELMFVIWKKDFFVFSWN